jgi:hypothetical protein
VVVLVVVVAVLVGVLALEEGDKLEDPILDFGFWIDYPENPGRFFFRNSIGGITCSEITKSQRVTAPPPAEKPC